MNKIYSFFFCIFTFALLCGCQGRQLYKDSRVMLGTFVEVISPYKEAPGIVFTEIKRIENLLSKYSPESEVSKLNKLGNLKVSPETFYIIKKSKEFWQVSDGAFDITVAPLVDLWGFTDRKYYLPKEEEIKNILNLVGSNKIILKELENVIKFSVSGMKIDLGAIAKGYAVDCAVKKLKENNIKSCLINAGGQIYALGDKFGLPWKIAVRNPRGKDVIDYLALKDKAVSTSGDYEQYFMVWESIKHFPNHCKSQKVIAEGDFLVKGKRRYAHIFNPKTGYPADSGVISVTVIAQDGITCDALSTAIFVLGKEKGQELAQKFPGVEVRIIE
jgi:thiamine biosynthesis lipoprotein